MTHRLFLSLHCVLCLFTLVLVIDHKEIVVLLPFQMTSFGGLKLRDSRSFCFPPLHGLMWKDLKNGHFPEEECWGGFPISGKQKILF